MAKNSLNPEYKFYLAGSKADAPVNWQDIEILATFDNEAIQANITTDQFTFVNEELQKIRQHIENGLSGGMGIFEGLPFAIQLKNKNNSYSAFRGHLDLTDGYEDLVQLDQVRAKMRKDEGLNQLEDRLSALTYGYLEDAGVFNSSDYFEINYVVEKKLNAFDILVSNIILYMMIKELYESIKGLSDRIANSTAHATGGALGPVAAALYIAASVIIELAYIAIMIIAIVDLATNMVNTFIPPVRTTKCATLHTLISKVAGFLGYTFNSNITDLSEIYYIPSNPRLDEINKKGFIKKTKGNELGIPNSVDYGYNVTEMFELVVSAFNAKIQIIDGVMHIHNVDDPFWKRTALYTLPNVLQTTKKYNTEELTANFQIKFLTDLSDEWTIDEYLGTSYGRTTQAINTITKELKLIRGFDQVNLNVALGKRKDELTPLENFLKEVGGAIDSLTNAFGKGTNFKAKIKGKVGILKVSENNYTLSKLVRLTGAGRIPSNNSTTLSAKYLYENYHIGKSFVSNNFFGQKIVYNSIRIPFSFENFLVLIDNSYFHTFEGKEGKMVSIKWRIANDYAVVDYWIREPYTNNLKETFIEPD